MSIVKGIGDEVLYAALAAAAAPIAIALSSSFARRQPLNLVRQGSASVARLFKLLWIRVRLWYIRKAQSVASRLRFVSSRVSSRGSSSEPSQDANSSSTQTNPSARGLRSSAGRQAQGQSEQSGDSVDPASFVAREKDGSEAEMRRFFGGGGERSTEAEAISSGAGPSAPRPPPPSPSPIPRVPSSGDGVVSPPSGDVCCVCHDDFYLPCQANCGHWFCAECIMRVWHHGSALSPCRCPICRRTTTLLLVSEGTGASSPAASSTSPASSSTSSSRPSGSNEGASAASSLASDSGVPVERRLELLRDVAKYNRLFGGVRVSMWQRILDMPLLFRRMGRDLMDPGRALSLLHNVRFVVCTVCVGVYVLSPLDIISEGFLGLLGLVDDAVFLVCVAFYLTVLYRALLVARATAWPSSDAAAQPQQQTLDDSNLY